MSRRDAIRMDGPELGAFLAEEKTVVVATIGLDGWPHLMPLWYVVRGEAALWAWTYAASQKVRNLERDTRCTLQVEAGAEYGELRGVMVKAGCVLHRDVEVVAGIGAELAQRGLKLLDAPVTGSSPKAQDGTLTIMAGGDAEDFARAEALFEVMGDLVLHVGPLGQGEMVKLINNAVAAANAATIAEALLVGQATGVDLDALVQVMAKGSGGSAMLDLKAAPMRSHDYATLFKLEHMLKDVRLCLDEAQAANVPFDAAARAREVLVAAMARGHADDDFAALVEALEAFAGTRLGG